MLFAAYEALLSARVRWDERADAAVCVLIENSVEAERAASYHRALAAQRFCVRIEIIEMKMEFCDALH